jgi:aspartyl-tRNA synthetase
MSPQLHKQMAAVCSGFERVFETGPIFRADDCSDQPCILISRTILTISCCFSALETRRHLCEFTGLDLEMVIHEHYDELLEVFNELLVYIFDGINDGCKDELERVREQHPFLRISSTYVPH